MTGSAARPGAGAQNRTLLPCVFSVRKFPDRPQLRVAELPAAPRTVTQSEHVVYSSSPASLSLNSGLGAASDSRRRLRADSEAYVTVTADGSMSA